MGKSKNSKKSKAKVAAATGANERKKKPMVSIVHERLNNVFSSSSKSHRKRRKKVEVNKFGEKVSGKNVAKGTPSSLQHTINLKQTKSKSKKKAATPKKTLSKGKKNNTKFNFHLSAEDERKVPFNTMESSQKRERLQQIHSNLVASGISKAKATKILQSKSNQKKTTRQLIKYVGRPKFIDVSSCFKKSKWKRPPIKPIQKYLPDFDDQHPNVSNDNLCCSYQNTPWYDRNNDDDDDDSDTTTTTNTTSSSKSRREASHQQKKNITTEEYQSIPQTIMNKFNTEIVNFYNYVKLTEDEIRAREYIIKCITNDTKALFGSKSVRMSSNGTRAKLESYKKDKSSSRNQGEERDIHVQVFGSFATPEVSTFWSDVDLALWGIIDEQNDNDNDNYLKEIVSWENNGSDSDDNENDCVEVEDGNGDNGDNDELEDKNNSIEHEDEDEDSGKGDNIIRMTTGTLNRTMELLNDEKKATFNNIDKEIHGDKKESKEAKIHRWKAALGSINNANAGEDGDSNYDNDKADQLDKGLSFIIDRKGAKVIVGDHQEIDNKNEETQGMRLDEASNCDEEEIFEEKKDEPSEKESDRYDDEGNDDDSIDVMDSYYNRIDSDNNISQGKNNKGDDIVDLSKSSDESDDSIHDGSNNISQGNGIKGDAIIDLSKSSDESDDSIHEGLKEFVSRFESSDGLEINVTTSGIDRGSVARNGDSVPYGPQGDTRKMVIKALRELSGKIHRSSYARSVETRTKAKVPIICITTRLGFDGDIALGGHNGTDTSHYVRNQVNQYESFPVVILLLKVLLQQTNLDKPFTGGLGSYRLYVMVAHHYKTHISLGGGTSAAEILLTFLYRYGRDLDCNEDSLQKDTQNDIFSKPTIIYCDGGKADINAQVKALRCGDLFGVCYKRLLYMIRQQQCNVDISMIASVIKVEKLKSARGNCITMASEWKRMRSPNRYKPQTIIGSSKLGFTFSKFGSLKKSHDALDMGTSTGSTKRGPRGGLVPKTRPDIDAKPQGLKEMFLKGSKNRKNKKKQKRDTALKSFTTSQIEMMEQQRM